MLQCLQGSEGAASVFTKGLPHILCWHRSVVKHSFLLDTWPLDSSLCTVLSRSLCGCGCTLFSRIMIAPKTRQIIVPVPQTDHLTGNNKVASCSKQQPQFACERKSELQSVQVTNYGLFFSKAKRISFLVMLSIATVRILTNDIRVLGLERIHLLKISPHTTIP